MTQQRRFRIIEHEGLQFCLARSTAEDDGESVPGIDIMYFNKRRELKATEAPYITEEMRDEEFERMPGQLALTLLRLLADDYDDNSKPKEPVFRVLEHDCVEYCLARCNIIEGGVLVPAVAFIFYDHAGHDVCLSLSSESIHARNELFNEITGPELAQLAEYLMIEADIGLDVALSEED